MSCLSLESVLQGNFGFESSNCCTFPVMGIGGGIPQCRRKCRHMLVLRRQKKKKNAVVKVFTYAFFLFRFYSIVDNS